MFTMAPYLVNVKMLSGKLVFVVVTNDDKSLEVGRFSTRKEADNFNKELTKELSDRMDREGAAFYL